MPQENKILKEIQNIRNIKNRTEPQIRRLNVGFERAYLFCFLSSFSALTIHSIFALIF